MTSDQDSPAVSPRTELMQRVRLRRTLFAVGGGVVLSIVVALIHLRGQMRVDNTGLAALLGIFWLINLVFPVLILTGANLRLRDPSMTLAQMLWATFATFTVLYFVDEGRHLVLMVYLLAMMFGAFRMHVGEYLAVTLIAVLLYSLVIAALDRFQPHTVELPREFLEWLVFFVVMVGFSLLGSETSRLRSQLEQRNRELREARDAAAVASQAKSRFLASTSDELRTPLNTILGVADVVDSSGLEPAHRTALERAHHAGSHLASLVNSMIDLAKLESGDLELRRAPLDLAAELEAVHEMMLPEAIGRGIEFSLELDPGLAPAVDGDAMRLREVLVQLISNAIRFTRRGGIHLAAAGESEARVRFSVSDTGVGIASERIPGLLAPSPAGDPGHPGSGLGLTLCTQLVEQMEGVLEVTSTPGEGSCFSFSIPLPAARQGEPQISSLASRRVLVVDDSEDNRLLIRAFLKGAVRSLDEAENGLEGVERFRAGHHDVVLMDMHMPEMDGIQATQAIREIENREYAPRALILALTADDSVNDRARSLAAGCDDHLVKPVSKKALLAALAGHTSAT